MKNIWFVCVVLFLISCASSQPPQNPTSRVPSSQPAAQPRAFFEQVKIDGLPYDQRVGLFVESDGNSFKGCVIYLQGLGDSIRNHAPLFNTLNDAGYRVIAFDYLGQGGSDGTMASERVDAYGVPNPTKKHYEIGDQAKWVWAKFSSKPDPVYQRTCAGSPKMVLGWSTGGLSAYKLAHEGWADAVALIAPGIVPNICVGEAGHTSAKKCTEENLRLDHVITLRTLTTNDFANERNPHLDPIKPSSFLEIKEFATNLIGTAYFESHKWKMNPKIKGIVFLSGKEDTYVNRDRTKAVLRGNAPQFLVKSYDGSLHEIDNEVPQIANDMHARTVQFFDSVVAGR